MVTDGAPCYPSLTVKFGWRHEACNHSKGICCIKKRIGNKTVLIRTGGVDAMWRLSKSAIPCSLATRVNSQVNPCKASGSGNGISKLQRKPVREDRSHVAEAHGDVREGKNRASFQEKIPCKLQDIMKNTPDFPGRIQPFL